MGNAGSRPSGTCMPSVALLAKGVLGCGWRTSAPLIDLQEGGSAEKLPLLGRYHRAPRRIEDDYVIESSVLGSGCNGVVKLARSKACPSSTQRFAVKQIRLPGLSMEDRMRLRSETEIFLRMDHPHIARLYDVYESDEHLCLVMECMEGGELYHRLEERQVFTEAEAAEAVWQILLALNYIHSHGIVHRDLKLENFLYEAKDTDTVEGGHLKMIDFGFSKVLAPNAKMRRRLGTLPYSAPEVLAGSYASQCDLWSLGVIVFILLAGHMPFCGTPAVQLQRISEGKFVMDQKLWKHLSKDARHFTRSLLLVDPELRLSAEAALQHPWIVRRGQRRSVEVDGLVVDALRKFGRASRFRRCCMEIMAWSLSKEDHGTVREYFLAMDQNKQGTIALWELKDALQGKFCVPDDETQQIFDALDCDHDAEIQYSDFLAAMLHSCIDLHEGLLYSTFNRFDADHSGAITADDVRWVLGGDAFDGEKVEKLIGEADMSHPGRITYPDFCAYLKGTDPEPATFDFEPKLVQGTVVAGPEDAARLAPIAGCVP